MILHSLPAHIDPAELYRYAFIVAWPWAYGCLVEALRRSPLPMVLGLLGPGHRDFVGFTIAVLCLGAAKAAAVLWPLLLLLALRAGSLRPGRIGAWLMGVRA